MINVNISRITSYNVCYTKLLRTPRSNPATYTGLMDEIRNLVAKTKLSQIRGYTASRYSFNVKGGRCEKCSYNFV